MRLPVFKGLIAFRNYDEENWRAARETVHYPKWSGELIYWSRDCWLRNGWLHLVELVYLERELGNWGIGWRIVDCQMTDHNSHSRTLECEPGNSDAAAMLADRWSIDYSVDSIWSFSRRFAFTLLGISVRLWIYRARRDGETLDLCYYLLFAIVFCAVR